MLISKKLTQEKLQEILLDIYRKGQEDGNINVIDVIEDIKQQVIVAITSEQ